MGRGERDATEREATTTPEESEGADTRVGGVLEIESALSELPGADADIDEQEATGQVTQVQKLSRDAVPEAYPVAIDSEEAVGFRVRISVDRETMVYLAWPDTYDESADLACLLNDLGIAPDRFADIIGEEIDLVVLEGQWVPAVAAEAARPHPAAGVDEMPTIPEPSGAEPQVVMNDGTVAVVRDDEGTRVVSTQNLDDEFSDSTRPTTTTGQDSTRQDETSSRYYYGVLAVGGVWTGILFGLLTGLDIVPLIVTALAFLLSPVLFPFLIYRDAEHVEAHSDWSPHIAWTIGSFFWVLNAVVFLAYVYKRRQAMPDDQTLSLGQ